MCEEDDYEHGNFDDLEFSTSGDRITIRSHDSHESTIIDLTPKQARCAASRLLSLAREVEMTNKEATSTAEPKQ